MADIDEPLSFDETQILFDVDGNELRPVFDEDNSLRLDVLAPYKDAENFNWRDRTQMWGRIHAVGVVYIFHAVALLMYLASIGVFAGYWGNRDDNDDDDDKCQQDFVWLNKFYTAGPDDELLVKPSKVHHVNVSEFFMIIIVASFFVPMGLALAWHWLWWVFGSVKYNDYDGRNWFVRFLLYPFESFQKQLHRDDSTILHEIEKALSVTMMHTTMAWIIGVVDVWHIVANSLLVALATFTLAFLDFYNQRGDDGTLTHIRKIRWGPWWIALFGTVCVIALEAGYFWRYPSSVKPGWLWAVYWVEETFFVLHLLLTGLWYLHLHACFRLWLYNQKMDDNLFYDRFKSAQIVVQEQQFALQIPQELSPQQRIWRFRYAHKYIYLVLSVFIHVVRVLFFLFMIFGSTCNQNIVPKYAFNAPF